MSLVRQLVNSNEQNFLTVDGKFDNLASFLPATILDTIIKHCKSNRARQTFMDSGELGELR